MKKIKQPKQVKSFTVDGEVYSWFVERLKEAGEGSYTISSLLNDYMLDLQFRLEKILAYYEDNNISIDRSWVINAFFRRFKAYPPQTDPGIDYEMIQCLEDEVKYAAEEMLSFYKAERRMKLENRKQNIKVTYGICNQCKHWNLNDEWCSVNNKMVRYFERCESFKAKKGIKKNELEEVQIKGRLKATKGAIVID